MVNDAVIPMAAVGIKYFGGPLVTILASKTSRMYNSDIHEIAKLLTPKSRYKWTMRPNGFMGTHVRDNFFELNAENDRGHFHFPERKKIS